MKTKLTFKSFTIFFVIICCTYLLYFIIPFTTKNLLPLIFIIFFLILCDIWLIFGEMRTKFITVKFENKEIQIKRFFGLINQQIRFSEITGWKYSKLSSNSKTYEYIYLYQNNEKAVKISEYYHKNYYEVKKYIAENFKDLGYEKFSMSDELKEVFR